jgi:hypothetical protein
MPVLTIDHRSSDDTVAIARSRGARVIERDFDGFVDARRFALSHVQTPWTLMVDADEALDTRLRDAILAAPADFAGYNLSRTTFYRGRPMRMWSGERLLRLFKTGSARLESAPAAGGSAQLHERWEVNGPTGMLDGTLLHYSYPTPERYREKFEEYTAVEASGITPSRRAWLSELLRTPARFAWYALVRGAALDGLDGLRIAWWSARYPAAVRRKALSKGARR